GNVEYFVWFTASPVGEGPVPPAGEIPGSVAAREPAGVGDDREEADRVRELVRDAVRSGPS
uniref:hypothetical protein n=1 Tax=Actinoalloteichus spitiensis TaxID=252394 RepID=UPI000584FEFC